MLIYMLLSNWGRTDGVGAALILSRGRMNAKAGREYCAKEREEMRFDSQTHRRHVHASEPYAS